MGAGAGADELGLVDAVSELPQAARASTAAAVIPIPATPRTFLTENHSIQVRDDARTNCFVMGYSPPPRTWIGIIERIFVSPLSAH
jgi:hypothetical protein